MTTLLPTSETERIISLDILRGFAVLGILVMNIQSFSMISQTYLNPAAFGSLEGINLLTFIFGEVFFNLKFMALFSMMFGAGIILFTERIRSKNGKAGNLHYRRSFWLLLIGLAHAYLLWYGDILVPYALCGAFVFLFRNKKPGTLLIIGMIILLIGSGLYIMNGLMLPYFPEEAIQGIKQSWEASPKMVQKEIDAYTGTWAEQYHQRSQSALNMQTNVFLFFFFWRVSGLMLLGMALYKWGVLSAQRSAGFYLKGILYAFLPGLFIVSIGTYQHFAHDWAFEYSMFLGSQYNYWGSLGMAYGYICIVMLLVKSHRAQGLKERIGAVGRMAFTNYMMQSVIAAFIFYGIGFGLYGQVSRFAQLAFVLLIWVLEIAWSKPWLKRFYYGPFEWLWRTLTYWKWQKFRKVKQ